jgi:capsular polysaccharide transport system ATP-binding protein
MITFNNITKFYQTDKGPQYIFKDLSFSIPENHNIAILGRNGAGKSTLFRLIAGSEYVNSGKIITDKAISWPVALATGIHSQMTGLENVRFIGRVNGVENLDLYEERVKEFSDLQDKIYLPVKTYSSGMRAKLAFAACIAIDFDIYLIDEATSVADPKFRKKARHALIEKSKSANVIMISHELDEIRTFCDSAIVMEKGKLTFYNNLEEAINIYQGL